MDKIIWTASYQFIWIMLLATVLCGCTKQQEEEDNNPPITVTDIDGNTYSTVKIGGQVWMAGNLKTTRYRNGDTIPKVTDDATWAWLTNGAYCDYEHHPVNSETYGRLYNWHAVHTGILAPSGWHVPSDAEWAVLENYLGEESKAGGKLKEDGTTHWYSPNVEATNSTGFTALPGGSRYSTGSFYSIGYTGYWWTATGGTDPAYAWYRSLDFNSGFILRSEYYKVEGLSVRCIKD